MLTVLASNFSNLKIWQEYREFFRVFLLVGSSHVSRCLLYWELFLDMSKKFVGNFFIKGLILSGSDIPNKFGYRTAILDYNRIFDIRMNKDGGHIINIWYPVRISVILGNNDGGRNSISELNFVRISRFSGYQASGYQASRYWHLTVSVFNFTPDWTLNF